MTSPKTQTFALSELAKHHTVTFEITEEGKEALERESGMALVKQLKWEEVRYVHDPSFDRMIPYGKASDGKWYVDFGKGFEEIVPPSICYDDDEDE